MSALVAAVFVASLAGSLHCAGMCGPFVAFAVGGGERGVRPGAQLAYNVGRLVSYTALGAAAGAFGAALDLGGAVLGLQRAALVAAGAAMILFGVVTLLRLAGVGERGPKPPAFLQRAYLAVHRRAAAMRPVSRAATVGLGSTLLPCGWLYAFVVTAAGTGSAPTGAAAMAVFWTGTLPVMVALGVGLRRLAGPLAARLPALTATALIVVGLIAVAGRFGVAPPALDAATAVVPTEAVDCPLHP